MRPMPWPALRTISNATTSPAPTAVCMRFLIAVALAASLIICVGAFSAQRAPSSHAPSSASINVGRTVSAPAHPTAAYSVTGYASWYGSNLEGKLDARGKSFDPRAMTAAHRTLPLNSMATVTNLANGRRVLVRITDRGPYAHHRLIDVSRAAAEALGYVDRGTARVSVSSFAR